jgi:S-adenosyl methyltransferase
VPPRPPEPDTAAIARLYDVMRGGYHGRGADKDLAARIEDQFPGTAQTIRDAGRFHRRTAVLAVTAGGASGVLFGASGFPLPGPQLHEDAARANPGARFAYAADGSVIRALITRSLKDAGRAAAFQGSVRDPAGLLGSPQAAALGSPVSVHLPLVLHFWPADFAAWAIAEYGRLLRERGPGSSLVLSLRLADGGGEYARLLAGAGIRVYGHTAAAVEGWIAAAGLDPDPRGITDVRAWGRPWGTLREPPAGMVAGAVAMVPQRIRLPVPGSWSPAARYRMKARRVAAPRGGVLAGARARYRR